MTFSMKTLDRWKHHGGSDCKLSNWRYVETESKEAYDTGKLPRYAKWGNPLVEVPDGGSVDLYNLQYAHFDMCNVKFTFSKYYNVNAASAYMSPISVRIHNGGRSYIHTTGHFSAGGAWVYVRENTTNLVALRGYYSGRWFEYYKWYGSNTLNRLYYYIYVRNKVYIRTNSDSTSNAGYSDTRGLDVVGNAFMGLSGSTPYASVIIKNRTY